MVMEVWEKLWEQIVVVCPIVGYLIFFKVRRACSPIPAQPSSETTPDPIAPPWSQPPFSLPCVN